MKALTQAEAIQWCRVRKHDLSDQAPPRIVNTEFSNLRVEVPKLAEKQLWFSRFIEGSVRPWTRCLFWVTTYGVWPSSENWHLYYRLRQSCGDLQLIEDAPAHLFHEHETYDVISFVQIALGAGWDFYLLPDTDTDYSRIFVSHDEFVDFFMRHASALDDVRSDLLKAGVKILSTSAGAQASHTKP
jgi:hypothetical protein